VPWKGAQYSGALRRVNIGASRRFRRQNLTSRKAAEKGDIRLFRLWKKARAP
jgi:hypothetical protein